MKIAVVIPCHSYFDLLPKALDSLYGQSVQPDEIITVIDAQEKKGYEALIHWYAVHDRRSKFHVVCTGGDQGVSAARNLGFLAAANDECDWVIPFDEDDLLWPTFIESLREAIDWCPDVDVWYTDWTEFGDHLGFNRTPEYSFEELANHPFIPATAGIRVELWQKVRAKTGFGYDENLMRNGLRWEDYLFYLEAGLLGAKMARFGAGALLQVRRHGESGTDVANATIPEWRKYTKGKLREHYEYEVTW